MQKNDAINTTFRHVNVLSQQRRIRHLNGIIARNLIVKDQNGFLYYSLHDYKQEKEFYRSEAVRMSTNPIWKTLNIKDYCKDIIICSATALVVKLWQTKNNENDSERQILLKWKVNLTGLTCFGNNLQRDVTFKSNVLIFEIHNLYFIYNKSTEPEFESSHFQPEFVTDKWKKSYDLNAIRRIQTAFRAAVETHLRSKELKRHIDSKLMSGTQAKEKLVEKELLISDITRLQNRLKIAEQARNDLRNDLESFQFANRSAKIKLSEEYESLVRNRLKLEKKKDQYFDQREELVKIGTLLGQKRRKLITDLAFIYPIYESPHTRDYYVCNINLPNSDILFEKDENAVSAALGYTAHLISMIYYFLDVPLRYPIRFKCSRSEIIDNFQTVIPDKIFPLYARGKEKVVFEYAVWILNKNVAQLRQYCGLSTKDFRPTLANIMGLLNSRLSIHVDHSNLLSNFIIPSMTHLIPPNFGGPQPSKSKILINRITDDTAEEKASSSSCSSEDDEEDEIIENNGNVVLINNELSIDPITEEESLNSVQKKLDETGEDALLFDLEVENRTCRSNSEDGDCIRTSSNC